MSRKTGRHQSTMMLGSFLACVILFLTLTDWPFGILREFWDDHQFLSQTVSSILFVFLGLTLVADWIERREARRLRMIALVAYNAIARAPLGQRRTMWFAAYGGRFIDDQEFSIPDALQQKFHAVMARAELPEFDESDARNGYVNPAPIESRLHVLVKDPEWIEATYDLIRRSSYTYRIVVSRWIPLLSSTEESGKVLIELATQVREFAEIQYILLPLVRVGAELVIHGRDLRCCWVVTVGHDRRPVGAEPVVHGGDLRRCLTVVVGHDRRSWRYDCSI